MQNVQYEYLDSRYREIALLGSEEKKSTYLVQDEVSGRIFVKKYIQLESANVYEQLSGLDNAYLVKIFHVAENESQALVIMEYVSGRTIEEWLKEISVFSERETIAYMEQLLKGLDEIHKRGIIHRDINPKNVIISTDGVVKLLDFDIGRQYKKAKGSDTTILGTVGFAAPEQFGFTQSDKRTDVYAVGALMNVMLTGKLPGELMYQNGNLGKMIKKCTQLDPEKRYQSAGEMLRELLELNERKTQLEKSDTSVQSRSIVPGFRTGKLWKKVVASVYYVVMGIYSVASVTECSVTLLGGVLEFFAVGIYVWLAVFLSFNFLDWMGKVPIIKKLNRSGKMILGVLLWISLFYCGYALEEYVRIDMLHIAVRTTE